MEADCELLRHVRGLTEHLASERLDLLDAARAPLLLLDGEVVAELVLVLLLEEVDEELAAAEHFRLDDGGEELLVVDLLLVQLLFVQLLLLIHEGKWRDNHLWVLLDQVVPQLHEVNVQALHLPAHGVRVENHHKALRADAAHDLRGDKLVATAHVRQSKYLLGDIDLRVRLLVEDGLLALLSGDTAEGLGAAHRTY